MQDRPTAAELLDAVAGWLEDELMPALDGRLRFHSRVAANVLRILEREWLQEEPAIQREWQRLDVLLGSHERTPTSFEELRRRVRERNAELGTRIRQGELDDRWQEVFDAVYASTAEKLAIANPGYAVDDKGRE